MRPTDENQYGSTRPNLMSSNRRGGEESILSMLERDSGRSRRHPAGRLTLYAAAGVVLLGLVGTIAWLARDQPGSRQAAPPVARTAPAVAMAEAGAAPPEAHGHAEGAAIIDSPEPPPLGAREPAPAQAAPEAPPLVLVAPDEPGPAPAAAMSEPAPAVPAVAAPSRAPRSAAPRPRATAKAAGAGKSQLATRRQPPARKARPAPARDGVDTDVALISAIISHSGKRPADDEASSNQQ